jgi:hypothetical protein
LAEFLKQIGATVWTQLTLAAASLLEVASALLFSVLQKFCSLHMAGCKCDQIGCPFIPSALERIGASAEQILRYCNISMGRRPAQRSPSIVVSLTNVRSAFQQQHYRPAVLGPHR